MKPSITDLNAQEHKQRGSIRPLKRHQLRMKPSITDLNAQEHKQRGSIRPLKRHQLRMKPSITDLNAQERKQRGSIRPLKRHQMRMKPILIICLLLTGRLLAQADTTSVVVHKDPRLDLLIKKQIQINEETTRESRRNMPGYRIQVINSKDRNKVFAVKTKIYQDYPELKPYLMYQPPNYKLKVGNFRTEDEATPYLKQLSKLYPSGVYLIRDIIEVKPEKPNE